MSTDATTPISTTPPGPGSPRTCWQPGRVGGHARPPRAPSLTRSFTCCEPVASGACYPASSRARAPFTINFMPGRMQASWPNRKGRFMRRRATEPRLLAMPFGGHPGQSVGQDHPSAEASLVSMGTNGSKGENASRASSMLCAGCGPSIPVKQSLSL
jgi:hypothetical protein